MSATSAEIVVPNTVEEFLEACESGEPWTVEAFVVLSWRQRRRTPHARGWAEAGRGTVVWDRPPTAPGHYVGRASVVISTVGRLAPRALLRGPLGAVPLEERSGAGGRVRPGDRVEKIIRLTVM